MLRNRWHFRFQEGPRGLRCLYGNWRNALREIKGHGVEPGCNGEQRLQNANRTWDLDSNNAPSNNALEPHRKISSQFMKLQIED